MKNKLIFFPSLTAVIFLGILFSLVFLNAHFFLGDGDTGFHIRTGDILLKNHSFPWQDVFGFIQPPPQDFPHSWLSQIIMSILHRVWGLSGIVVFFASLLALTFSLVFTRIKNHYNFYIALLLFISSYLLAHIQFYARPLIFSGLFFIFTYFILEDHACDKKNRLILLPLLMGLWVNLHSGYMAGFILLGVYLTDFFFSSKIATDSLKKREFLKKFKNLIKISFFCLLAVLVNPQGYKIFSFFYKFHTQNKIYVDVVSEFISPNFHDANSWPFLFILYLSFLVFILSRPNIRESIFFIGFSYMTLYSFRYGFQFGLIIPFILAPHLQALMNQYQAFPLIKWFRESDQRLRAMDQQSIKLVWPMGGLVAIFFLMVQGHLNVQWTKGAPIEAMEFIMKENIPGHVFTSDEFGDYFIYYAWPKYRPFMDSRAIGPIKDYLKVTRLNPDWEKVFEKYQIEWVFYYANTPVSVMLASHPDWHLIYADKITNIFVKKTVQYQALIEKYPNIQLVYCEGKDCKGSP